MRSCILLALVLFAGSARAQWGWEAAPASWDWEKAAPKAAPKPAPKPAPKWIPYANGWWQSSVSGHWWHGYYGHYDRDTVWDEGGTAEEPVLTQWEMEHQPEPPNTHVPEHLNRPPVYWQAAPMPTFHAPPVSFGGLRGGGRFFFRGGGACST